MKAKVCFDMINTQSHSDKNKMETKRNNNI